MHETQSIILSKEELDTWMQDLQSIGISRVKSSILLTGFLSPKFISKDVESKFNLQQPEVSMGLKKMSKDGLISSESMRNQGLGRPTQLYRLTRSLEDILTLLSIEKSDELGRIKKVIQKIQKKNQTISKG